MTITDIENGKRISLVLKNTGDWASSLQVSDLEVSGEGYSLVIETDDVSDIVINGTDSTYFLEWNHFLTLHIDFVASALGEFPGIFSLSSSLGEYSWNMQAQVLAAQEGISVFMEIGFASVKKVDHVLKSKISGIS
jgi:hypothetical protein